MQGREDSLYGLASQGSTQCEQCWAHCYWWQKKINGLVIAVLSYVVQMNSAQRIVKELPFSCFPSLYQTLDWHTWSALARLGGQSLHCMGAIIEVCIYMMTLFCVAGGLHTSVLPGLHTHLCIICGDCLPDVLGHLGPPAAQPQQGDPQSVSTSCHTEVSSVCVCFLL